MGDGMPVIAWIRSEPCFDGRMRVGAVVVEDQMNVAPRRARAIELLQEGQECGVSLAGRAPREDSVSERSNAANRFVV